VVTQHVQDDEVNRVFMAMSGSYKTIAEPVRTEIRVRGSRFIATALPVSTKEEAAAELARIQKEFWDATHNCYAYRLAPDGLQYRFADDGEPSGSAGKPILFVLQQRELADCLVVVTRYFGGTKLGVGGLVRAYSDATIAALDLTRIVTCHPTDSVRIFATYDDMRAVRQLVERYALRMEEEFEDVVRYTVDLRSDQVEEFSELLTEVSQGRAGMVNLDQIDRA
jgi:uncharacterized YigZ family protein